MPTVIAPAKAASPPATSATQSASGNKPAEKSEDTADFASVLGALKKQSAESASTASPDADASAVLAELTAMRGKKDDKADNETTFDIAAMLGQINAPTNSPAALPSPTIIPGLPALPPNADRRAGDFVQLSGDEKPDRPGQDIGLSGFGTKMLATDDAPGRIKKDPAEPATEFSLPDTAPDGAFRLHGAEGNKALSARSEQVKFEVATPVQSPNWSSDLGQKIVWMAKNNLQEA